jgi:hypothetical protein
MMDLDRRKEIDLLIEEFWRKGYLTVSRKFGTYLPEPADIGGFEVDVVAKQRNTYAIGITLTDQDFKDLMSIKNKLLYLANRQTRGSNKKVQLFVGVSLNNFQRAKNLLEDLDSETRKNIKLFQILEKLLPPLPRVNRKERVLFS